jgi:acyl-CoA synthetase (AMP-forming)/AMP-acid ligase II
VEGQPHPPLRWSGADCLDENLHTALFGPGAPFELVVEDVLGAPVEVFVQRPASVTAILDTAVAAYPDRTYLNFPDDSLTYADVATKVEQLAGVLWHDYGVRSGDRVAVVSANNLGYALTIWATLRLGAILVGLNGWWTGSELRYGIELTTPCVVLGDDPRLRRLATADADLGMPVAPFTSVLGALGETAKVAPPCQVVEDAAAMVMFTSGTTGSPKGATLSHRSLAHFGKVNFLRAAMGALQSGAIPDPTFQAGMFCAGPMFHVSGSVVLLGSPWTGTQLVFPPPGRWDETTQLKLSAEHRITSWSAVPTQLLRLIEHPDLDTYDLSALRVATSGGANLPPDVIRLFRERLPHVALGTGYGMSETAGLGTSISGPRYVANPTSIGEPAPTSQVQVRRPDGSVATEGEVGELALRNASSFLGYWADPDATDAALDAERWYRTGDFGRVDSGMVYLDGRGSDRIIRGGENISSIEIENRLVEHPAVDSAAVIGVDHQSLGQEVMAIVVLSLGAELTDEDVTSWVGIELAPYKVPSKVVFVDELPYTATGKVHRKALEERWRA